MKKRIAVLVLICMICSTMQVWALEEDEGEKASGNTGVLILTPEEAAREKARVMRENSNYSGTATPANELKSLAVEDLYVATMAIRQCETYYCGPAAVLQALYSAGAYSSVPGDTSTAKQRTLATSSYLCTDRDEATSIYNMPSTMNHFTGRARAWTLMRVSTDSKWWLVYGIRKNHSEGDAVIYLLDTDSLTYYGGANYTHYITGTGITFKTGSTTDYSNITVRLQDPHYDSSYYGRHTVPFMELATGMSAISYDNLVY